MKAEASKIRQDFATYLKIAGEGNEIFVTRHGVVLAKISPVGSGQQNQQDDIDAFCSLRKKGKEDGVAVVNRMRAKTRY